MSYIQDVRQRQHFSAGQVAQLLDLSLADYEQLENTAGFTDVQLQKLAVLFRTTAELLKNGPPKKKKKAKKRTRVERNMDPGYVSDEELAEARKTMPGATVETVQFLRFIAEMVVENTLREVERESRLEKEPQGFRFEEQGFTCWICHGGAAGGWYDRYGLKCAACQEAVDQGLVPGEITRDNDLFYTEYQLETYFAISRKAARQFIKAGLLHPRAVGNRQTIYVTIQQNNFLPPKDLLQDSLWYQTSPDPAALIAAYGIFQYIQFTR